MKKAVFKVGVDDDKVKSKVLKSISSLAGVDSISVDMKEKKLTVIGDIDPVSIVKKLRRLCQTEVVSVGPAKDPEKKDDEKKKKDAGEPRVEEFVKSYPYLVPSAVPSAQDNPDASACVIL